MLTNFNSIRCGCSSGNLQHMIIFLSLQCKTCACTINGKFSTPLHQIILWLGTAVQSVSACFFPKWVLQCRRPAVLWPKRAVVFGVVTACVFVWRAGMAWRLSGVEPWEIWRRWRAGATSCADLAAGHRNSKQVSWFKRHSCTNEMFLLYLIIMLFIMDRHKSNFPVTNCRFSYICILSSEELKLFIHHIW